MQKDLKVEEFPCLLKHYSLQKKLRVTRDWFIGRSRLKIIMHIYSMEDKLWVEEWDS